MVYYFSMRTDLSPRVLLAKEDGIPRLPNTPSNSNPLHEIASLVLSNSKPIEQLRATRGDNEADKALNSTELLTLTKDGKTCYVLLETHGFDISARKLQELAILLDEHDLSNMLILLEGSGFKFNFGQNKSDFPNHVIPNLEIFGANLGSTVLNNSVPNLAGDEVPQRMLSRVVAENPNYTRSDVIGWIGMARGLDPNFIKYFNNMITNLSFLGNSDELLKGLTEFYLQDEKIQLIQINLVNDAIAKFNTEFRRDANFGNEDDCKNIINYLTPESKHLFSRVALANHFERSPKDFFQLSRLIEFCDRLNVTPNEVYKSLTNIYSLKKEDAISLINFMNPFLHKTQDELATEILLTQLNEHETKSPIIICAGFMHKKGIMEALKLLGFSPTTD